ncbi:efflux RND transporter periplasmic adaptor subunit [Clostridium rectalis]|uniref:efflux RND transporter periplasmic adaptor subunit n=1 Tax=Clostridium rectalis TaxID=2040295 RepID=UPI000F634348|nr:efflux RND transporter periplasmic adaptor subunit [Clostridium rectalis]
MKKEVIGAIVTVTLISGGIISYNYICNNRRVEQKVNEYTKVKSIKGDIEKSISGSGSIQTSRIDAIKYDYKDTVKEVLVKENSVVKKGDILITFERGNVITAPYDGIISTVNVKAESNVNSGQEVLTIKDNKNLVIKIQVDEKDLSSIKNGQVVSIVSNAYNREKFSGKVSDISEQGEYSNGVTTFQVTITIDDVKNLKIGMSVETKITVESKKNTLLIPINAVKTSNGSKHVLIYSEEGVTKTKKVETGISNDTYVEITSGLSEDDEIMIKNNTNSNNKIESKGGMQGGFGKINDNGRVKQDENMQQERSSVSKNR